MNIEKKRNFKLDKNLSQKQGIYYFDRLINSKKNFVGVSLFLVLNLSLEVN